MEKEFSRLKSYVRIVKKRGCENTLRPDNIHSNPNNYFFSFYLFLVIFALIFVHYIKLIQSKTNEGIPGDDASSKMYSYTLEMSSPVVINLLVVIFRFIIVLNLCKILSCTRGYLSFSSFITLNLSLGLGTCVLMRLVFLSYFEITFSCVIYSFLFFRYSSRNLYLYRSSPEESSKPIRVRTQTSPSTKILNQNKEAVKPCWI